MEKQFLRPLVPVTTVSSNDAILHVFMLFLKSIQAVIMDKLFQASTARHLRIKAVGKLLTAAISSKASFCDKILKSVDDIIDGTHNISRRSSKSGVVNRPKVWSAFHSFRQDKLCFAWNAIDNELAMEIEPILSPAASERLLLDIRILLV